MGRRCAVVVLGVPLGLASMVAAAHGAAAGDAGRVAGRAVPQVSLATTTVPPAGSVDASRFDELSFFEDFALAVNDHPDDLSALAPRLVAGSPAEAFVHYLAAFAAARRDNPQEDIPPFTVDSLAGGAVEVCSVACDVFGDFLVVDGRLESFTLNFVSISDRLGRRSKELDVGSVTVVVTGALRRITADELAVVLAVGTSEEPIRVDWAAAEYITPSGVSIPVDLESSAFDDELPARTRRPIVLQFRRAGLGGTVVFTFTSPSSPDPVVVRVDVDELAPI